ncbi:MAG: hypothetical protein JRF30_00430 [Deltaproteobacteria bacterium]|nr:hypothetical protein [Deltaproteobacteria bacterium]MBW1795460.1 hypothetical protein [Deltaproteobacteria bacterium]MBW2329418.1 hypothetical protein [Deltaproteobacteria bacterium]
MPLFTIQDLTPIPPRLLLEAERKALYDAMLVPPDWHQDYAEGKTTTRGFHKFIRGHMVKNGGGAELSF